MITLGTTYYNCPEVLQKYIDNHIDSVDHLIIVDDGSHEDLRAKTFVKPDPKISLYEVTEDIGFNSHGCRNLIMTECQTEWCILMDCDRQIINNGLQTIREDLDDLDKNTRYSFSAHTEKKGYNTHISVNDYLIRKETFWLAGGYDEEYVGIRRGDREYFIQLSYFSKHDVLVEVDMILLRQPSVFTGQELINNKSPKMDEQKLKEVAKAENRIKTPVSKKSVIQFDWMKIF